MFRRFINYQGPIIWNSHDLNIKTQNSTKLFKYDLKKSLLSRVVNRARAFRVGSGSGRVRAGLGPGF